MDFTNPANIIAQPEQAAAEVERLQEQLADEQAKVKWYDRETYNALVSLTGGYGPPSPPNPKIKEIEPSGGHWLKELDKVIRGQDSSIKKGYEQQLGTVTAQRDRAWAALRDMDLILNEVDWDDDCDGLQAPIRKKPNGRYEYLGGDTWRVKHEQAITEATEQDDG